MLIHVTWFLDLIDYEFFMVAHYQAPQHFFSFFSLKYIKAYVARSYLFIVAP